MANNLSPHDRFVRSLMTNPQVIKEFFTTHLPAHIKDLIDLDSIQPQKDSFVDDKLRLQIADLLYSVNIQGETGYVYLLMEHASSADKMLPLRMLKYVIAVMEHHLKKEKSKKLPFVYPFILYTGSKAYPYSLDLFDLFGDQKALARDTLLSPCSLLDLTQVSDAEFDKYLWFGTMALVAKHIHDPDIIPFMHKLTRTLKILDEKGESSYIYTIMSYIVETAEISSQSELFRAVQDLESLNEEKIMTLAEQWKQEGFQKGIQTGMEKGIQKGREEGLYQASHNIALNFLKLSIGVDQISQATGLSLKEIEALKKQL